jgi:hypothetical protein
VRRTSVCASCSEGSCAQAVVCVAFSNTSLSPLVRYGAGCRSYAVVNHVTDYDCWREAEEPVTVETLVSTMMGNVGAVKASVAHAVKMLAASPDLKSPSWVRDVG